MVNLVSPFLHLQRGYKKRFPKTCQSLIKAEVV